MICSKFPTFVVESTTSYRLQIRQRCCDLLEISYLCGRINNTNRLLHGSPTVVICSKFPTFVVESTTIRSRTIGTDSCDLLEISYLCGRINNTIIAQDYGKCVVICSKFPTFVVESTTLIVIIAWSIPL